MSRTTLSIVRMRERVEDEWNELRQKEGESIMSFYGRAKAIRMKLESYGDKRLSLIHI